MSVDLLERKGFTMRLNQKKEEYDEHEIEAQGCWNDCKVKVHYANNGEAAVTTGGSAVTIKCGTYTQKTPKTNPFL